MQKLVLLLAVATGSLAAQSDCPTKAQGCAVQATPGGGTVTTATYYHVNESAVRGSEAATAAGMLFIFDIAPALVTMHNEKIHAIEGRYATEFEELEDLLAVPAPSIAPENTNVSMNGFRLKETWSEFLAASPLMGAAALKCSALRPAKQSAKHQVFDPCADARYMMSSGAGRVVITCRTAPQAKDTICKDFDGEVIFVNRELSAFKLILPKLTQQDVVRQLGRPSGFDRDGGSMVWHSAGFDASMNEFGQGVGFAAQSRKN